MNLLLFASCRAGTWNIDKLQARVNEGMGQGASLLPLAGTIGIRNLTLNNTHHPISDQIGDKLEGIGHSYGQW